MINRYRLSLFFAGLAAVAAAAFLFVILGSGEAPAFLAPPKSDDGRVARNADRIADEILKRPLFTPGRRPPEEKVEKPEPPQLQGRLAGVMLRPDVRIALFTRPGGKPISVKEGDVIDGWTASKIEAGRVVLTSAFGEQVVKPTNGSQEEISQGRPIKAKSTKNKSVWPGQNPSPKPQQMVNGAIATGQQ
jgi:hypothetical protein